MSVSNEAGYGAHGGGGVDDDDDNVGIGVAGGTEDGNDNIGRCKRCAAIELLRCQAIPVPYLFGGWHFHLLHSTANAVNS